MAEEKKWRREFSAGGVVFKREKEGIKFLLGKHSGYHKWVLPKGLIEKGESSWKTAVRETEEEMGVKARVVEERPIHTERYVYVADFKSEEEQKGEEKTRRVKRYQETGGGKVKVFKTVTFYLMEYEGGDPSKHGWEMEEAGWFSYEEAVEKLAFKGEREALKKARERVEELTRQPRLV